MANRLAKETSPYLQQHKDNPVDWYPWGDEAIQRAKSEDKPILLSIGYSACHWCHVMEHESFENPEIARQMNESFVCIKVDREERPDLDQIYQKVAQLITRGGGWPLTVFLTPALEPYFGGTYFPPEDKWGRPGFPKVLKYLSEAYRNDRLSVAQNARTLLDAMKSVDEMPDREGKLPTGDSLKAVAENLAGYVDPENGGFGGAPKFPNPMGLTFLWRTGRMAGDERLRDAAVFSLRKMAEGGIYDQLGGGFHRYTVDGHWSVPHFEKMLYDNGLLIKLYSEVLLSARNGDAIGAEDRALFTRVVRETVGYVLREMTSPEGGFYSAQDADSEGEEGKFFAWDPADLSRVLMAEEVKAFALRYGVSDGGNFEHGKTVLFAAAPLANVARAIGTDEAGANALLASACAKMMRAREQRVRPGRDDKVLVSWNGLMITGLAWASLALEGAGDAEGAKLALNAARGAFRFIVDRMSDPDGRMRSTYKDGQARLNAYLDDYALAAMAALDLARASNDPVEIESCTAWSVRWIDQVLRRFKAHDGKGYHFTSDDHEQLIQRPRTIQDQAIPSGTAVTLGCLAAFTELMPERAAEFEAELDRQLGALYPVVEGNPFGYAELLNAALLRIQGAVAVSGASAKRLCWNERRFQKPAQAPGLLVCHAKTCTGPYSSPEAAEEELRNVI